MSRLERIDELLGGSARRLQLWDELCGLVDPPASPRPWGTQEDRSLCATIAGRADLRFEDDDRVLPDRWETLAYTAPQDPRLQLGRHLVGTQESCWRRDSGRISLREHVGADVAWTDAIRTVTVREASPSQSHGAWELRTLMGLASAGGLRSIERLDFSGPTAPSGGYAHWLTGGGALRTLRLTRCDMGADQLLDFLAEAHLERLERLDLTGNPLGDDGPAVIAMAELPRLRTLDLTRCGIGPRGAAALMSSTLLAGLEVLVAGGNALAAEEAAALARAAADRGCRLLGLESRRASTPIGGTVPIEEPPAWVRALLSELVFHGHLRRDAVRILADRLVPSAVDVEPLVRDLERRLRWRHHVGSALVEGQPALLSHQPEDAQQRNLVTPGAMVQLRIQLSDDVGRLDNVARPKDERDAQTADLELALGHRSIQDLCLGGFESVTEALEQAHPLARSLRVVEPRDRDASIRGRHRSTLLPSCGRPRRPVGTIEPFRARRQGVELVHCIEHRPDLVSADERLARRLDAAEVKGTQTAAIALANDLAANEDLCERRPRFEARVHHAKHLGSEWWCRPDAWTRTILVPETIRLRKLETSAS